MKKSIFLIALFTILFQCASSAANIKVVSEHSVRAIDGWQFSNITGPSLSDFGRDAVVTIVSGSLSPDTSGPNVLTDGFLSVTNNDLKNGMAFDGATAKGRILLDLGKPIPIAMIATYSRHGDRYATSGMAPQVYKVYGINKNGEPDVKNKSDWTLIADVDTRPSRGGNDWGGRYGVNITGDSGDIGNYRWLLFEVSPTGKEYFPEERYMHTLFSEIDVHTKESLKLAGDSPFINPMPVKEVIVVFKTHFDIGYTDLAENVINHYRTDFMDNALNTMEASNTLPPEQQFVWTLPGWPMTIILDENQTVERRAKIVDAIKQGRFVWHALPFTTHTESLDLEDVVRGLRFSSDLSRKFGVPLPRDAKMTDVPSHSWILPTLLKNAGVDFLHIGCNSMSASPSVPDLFWWEGPDGSRLLTFYVHASYGTGIIPPDNWPYETWLAMVMTGDNQGPPSPEAVKRIFEQAKEDLPGATIRLGRMSDFADAILKENPDLKVVRGDMPDTWIHGLMTLPQGTATARKVRPEIAALESLDTNMNMWGLQTPPASESISAAYENSLLYGEHTWGMNSFFSGFRYGEEWRKAYDEGVYAKAEKSFDDHYEYIRKARGIVEPAIEERMNELARNVGVDGPRVVVYNPLPWRRDALVKLPDDLKNVAALRDPDSGATIAVSRGEDDNVFIAKDLPPMGYRTFVPSGQSSQPTVSQDQGNVLENDYFKVTLDPQRGGVRSIIDKKTGAELVDSSEYVLGQYLVERYDADDVAGFINSYSKTITPSTYNDFGKKNLPGTDVFTHTNSSPTDYDVSIKRDSVRETAVMMAKPGNGIPDETGLRVTLYQDGRFIDLEWFVTNRTMDPWPEAGWLVLPFAVDKPELRLGRLASIIDPSSDIVDGANHYLFHLTSGMLAKNSAGGVGVLPVDSPLVSIGETGIWKYSRTRVPEKPVVFVNLYNNMWSTNFRMWQNGSWSSRVRIWPVKPGDDEEKSLITPGWETRTDGQAAYYDGPAGNLPTTQSGLSLSCKGVLATAFGKNPDGDGTLLRLWEQAGIGRECDVLLPGSVKFIRAQRVDLRGTPTGETIPVDRNKFTVMLKPFAPMSYILE